MKWCLALLAAVPAQAYLRFGCSRLIVQRLDPIVEPGVIPSAHMHQIVGGNAFNATMDPADDPSKRATCTTCKFKEDMSNYWTAVLYFRAQNGTFHRVEQYPNSLIGQLDGGMTVYYIQRDFSSNGNQKITSFKPGFRMTVGSPTEKEGVHPGLTYTCLQNVNTRFPETQAFPSGPCPAGIMANHHFPNCWDGKNLDSANHQDHMYYSGRGGFIAAGPCPASHPVAMPQVAFETMWDTTKFNDRSMWPTDGSQPFFWSFVDSNGYGTHADYLFGWEGDSLQRAMDHRGLINDAALTGQTDAVMNGCHAQLDRQVDEEIDGWFDVMPGQANNMDNTVMKRVTRELQAKKN